MLYVSLYANGYSTLHQETMSDSDSYDEVLAAEFDKLPEESASDESDEWAQLLSENDEGNDLTITVDDHAGDRKKIIVLEAHERKYLDIPDRSVSIQESDAAELEEVIDLVKKIQNANVEDAVRACKKYVKDAKSTAHGSSSNNDDSKLMKVAFLCRRICFHLLYDHLVDVMSEDMSHVSTVMDELHITRTQDVFAAMQMQELSAVFGNNYQEIAVLPNLTFVELPMVVQQPRSETPGEKKRGRPKKVPAA